MEYYSNLKSLCRHSPQNLHFVDISWLIQFIFSHAQVLAIAYGNFIDGPLGHFWTRFRKIPVTEQISLKLIL